VKQKGALKATVMSELALYRLLTYHVPTLMSIFLSLDRLSNIHPRPRPFATLRNKLILYGEELLASRPTPSWRTALCWLSATAYAVSSTPNLRTRHAEVTRDPLNMYVGREYGKSRGSLCST
jgi:hypothetical protein